MNDCKVRDLMTRTVVSVAPGDSIAEVAKRLAAKSISAAPVVEHDIVVGVISESDILQALPPSAPPQRRPSVLDYVMAADRPRSERHHRTAPTVVRDAMSRSVAHIPPEASIWEAAALMRQRGVKRLPVIDEEDRLVGIISRADLVRAMARTDESIRADIVHSLQTLGEPSRGVEVSVDSGMVTLTGVAPDATVIRVAAELAGRVAGVIRVNNLVERESIDVEVGLRDEDLRDLDPFAKRRTRH